MLLKELLAEVPGILGTRGNMEMEIGELVTDSRIKAPVHNGLFFCISGMHFDAHN